MDQNHWPIINQQHDGNNRYFKSKFSTLVQRGELELLFFDLFLLCTQGVCVWVSVFFVHSRKKIFSFLFICLKRITKSRSCAFLIYVFIWKTISFIGFNRKSNKQVFYFDSILIYNRVISSLLKSSDIDSILLGGSCLSRRDQSASTKVMKSTVCKRLLLNFFW